MNDWFLNYFSNFYNFLLNHWNLNNSLYFLNYLSCLNDWSISKYLFFYDSILINKFLSNNLNFIWLSNNCICLNNFLYNLRNFYNFLNCLNNWNWLLDNSLNYLIFNLNMILYLFSNLWSIDWNCYLYFLLYLNNLWNLNNFLDNFLMINWNLFNYLYNFLL